MLCSWFEHDPLQIMESVHQCIEGALSAARDAGREIKIVAVGVTNQRETTLVWNKETGKPYHNAIVWFDSRTAGICRAFKERLGSSVIMFCPSDRLYTCHLLCTLISQKGET